MPVDIGIYSLHIDGKNVIPNIVQTLDNPDYTSLSRMVSLALASDVPMHRIVEQLQKVHRSKYITSLPTVMARVLKHYIKDGTKASYKCPACGGTKLQYIEGCVNCSECGWSKCG